jgi:hypothetical protein
MLAWHPCAQAQGPTGGRNIVGLGCDYAPNGTQTSCYVTLDGAPFGPASCTGNQARWDSNTPAGKNQLALFLAAYYGSKQISLQIDSACYPGGYPAILWSNQ